MSPEGAPSPPEAFRDLLAASAPRFTLSLPPDTVEALSRFLAELDRWRRAMDLTGPMTAAELADHTLESALGANLIPRGASVLDIGSGAGFPGVPLAVCRPDLAVSALEPRSKRSEFLRHVSRSVPVSNLEILRGRLESLEAGPFAVATSRAVGHVAELTGEAQFLAAEGLLLVWTTDEEALSRELSPVFRLERVERVPGSRRRAIAVFRKVAEASRQGSKDRDQGVFPVERSG